jgi:hypothetical protein
MREEVAKRPRPKSPSGRCGSVRLARESSFGWCQPTRPAKLEGPHDGCAGARAPRSEGI